MNSKRILVTGATGFLGSRLLERLAEDKTVTVTATVVPQTANRPM